MRLKYKTHSQERSSFVGLLVCLFEPKAGTVRLIETLVVVVY
jgi:hypothetical protein